LEDVLKPGGLIWRLVLCRLRLYFSRSRVELNNKFRSSHNALKGMVGLQGSASNEFKIVKFDVRCKVWKVAERKREYTVCDHKWNFLKEQDMRNGVTATVNSVLF